MSQHARNDSPAEPPSGVGSVSSVYAAWQPAVARQEVSSRSSHGPEHEPVTISAGGLHSSPHGQPSFCTGTQAPVLGSRWTCCAGSLGPSPPPAGSTHVSSPLVWPPQ